MNIKLDSDEISLLDLIGNPSGVEDSEVRQAAQEAAKKVLEDYANKIAQG